MTVIHEVKSWPRFFGPIIAGTRRHELRRNDRGYEIGDDVVLREWDPDTQAYTGRAAIAAITSITSSDRPCAVSDEGLHPDFCILTIAVTSTSAPRHPNRTNKRKPVPASPDHVGARPQASRTSATVEGRHLARHATPAAPRRRGREATGVDGTRPQLSHERDE